MAARDVLKTIIIESKNKLMPICSGKENLPPYDGVMYRTYFATLPEIRAVLYFHAGDVQDIKLSVIDHEFLYVRAKVLASMKKTKYTMYVFFENQEAVHAFCQCPVP
ncbi:hypothetical protein MAR_036857 [Mya arenaria]|uniref:Uncharacterized protein n=1 Tax=Mya arenaria TaxID=6604 RepID=A0ABY7FLU0_MYAAR|nr:hypothetical protein MAR_036857 [Mya arenaria]